MANYTVKNLREVEDSAVKFGFAPEMSARFASNELGLEKSGVSLQGLAPNARGKFGHKHERQEELYVIVSGSGRVKLDDDVVELREWDAVRVPPEVARQFEAGPDGLEMIAFGAPRDSESAARDAQMLGDWWTE
jgi:quercetin dioxygenase-like cupin family protein